MSIREELVKMINSDIRSAVEKIDPNAVELSCSDRLREINRVENTIIAKKAVVRDLGDKPVTIIPISDLHLGNKTCNIEKFEQVIELINETPDCYTILLGDQTETATKTSVGLGLFEEDFNIPEQMKLLHKALLPLAKRGKILGALTGNHEMRVAYAVKVNPVEVLSEQLGTPYFGYQGYISLHVGKQIYHIFCHHGASGGVSPSGKLAAIRALGKVACADIYLSGHTHAKLYDQDLLYAIDDTTGEVVPRVRHYVACGSFLEYWGSYPEMKLLSPASTGSVLIKLNPVVKDVQIIL